MKHIKHSKLKVANQLAILNLVKKKEVDSYKQAITTLTPLELAEIISHMTEEDQPLFFQALAPKISIETFDYLPPHTQRRVLKGLGTEAAATLLKELSPDDRTKFLQELPRNVIEKLVTLLPHDERLQTITLLGYPEGSIGRLMTPDYIAVKPDWTIEKVLDHIQAYGHDSETINVIYVIDDHNKLLDDIKLKDFLFVPRKSKVESISDYQFIALLVTDSDEVAINTFELHDRVALPVIDPNGTLLGIVTIDDVLRLASEETTEDMQKIGGMEALDEPYMEAPFLELMRKRAGWLVILFIGEMFTATAMGYFEEEIAKAVVLALFIPLIISSGGNAGSQASTLVIRAMALGEVTPKDFWRIVKKEVFSGLFLGTILGLIGFFRVTLWSFFTNIYGEHSFLVAITIGFSLIGVVLWGTLSGAILPLILRKAGVDPATSSAPFVATIVDVTGVIIYFMIAIAILSGTLL